MPRLPLDLGWMRVLAEVGRAGSFSAAAARLGISQPAVSYQIRRIEAALGTALVARGHRGVALTGAGQSLFALVDRAVHDLDALAAGLADRRRSVVRLFTDYAFASLWLIPRMHLFQDSHPDIDLQIVATQQVRPDRLEPDDVAVTFASRSMVPRTAHLLVTETVVPLCSPRLRGAPEPGCDPAGGAAALAGLRLIYLDSAGPAPWHTWDSYFASFGLAPDPTPGPDRAGERGRAAGDLRFNTYSHVVQAAAGAQGVALGWRGLVEGYLADGTLRIAGPELTAPDRGYWLIRPDDPGPAAATLGGWLSGAAADPAAALDSPQRR